MTKRKAATLEAPPVVAEDLKPGLTICPTCEGYGGLPRGDEWIVCRTCGGGGRVDAKEETT